MTTDGPLLELVDFDVAPLRFKPGQSFRFIVQATLAGLLVAAAPTMTVVCLEDGSSVPATVFPDSPTGNFHADGVFPLTATPGVWCRRWQTTGTAPDQQALNERRFQVDPLAF